MSQPANFDTQAALFRRFGIEPNIRSSGSLDLQLRCFVRLLRELRAEIQSCRGNSWSRRIRAWRLGFRSRSAALYQIDACNRAGYIPDFAYAWHSYAINGFWNPIIGNKLVISQVLAAHGIPHPRVFGIISRGRILIPSPQSGDAGKEPLQAWTAEAQTVVFRPHWSGEGEGVFFVRREGEAWFVNEKEASKHDVSCLLAGLDRYIATAFVEQAAYARAIHPQTTNTLRVLTLVDAEGPFIASVVHRFGTARSFPGDHFHLGHGGVCAAVQLDAQRLGKAVLVDRHDRPHWHSVHPETGSPIEGVLIPGLHNALQGILAAARCFPEARLVGWDLLITDTGFSILEANSPPGIVVSQVAGPLLVTPRTAAFFAEQGFRVPVGVASANRA